MLEWNDKGIIRGRLRRKVSLAVLVIDDLTGRPIIGSNVTVTCHETMAKPVAKSDGYFLFLDCDAPQLTITAEGWAYHARTITVKQLDLSPLSPSVNLRLTPNQKYAIPQNTTCLQGTAPVGAQISVYCVNNPKPLRLLYDYQPKSPSIDIYDPTNQNQEGRQFALVTKGEKAPLMVGLSGVLSEEGQYRLDQPLTKAYTKASTTLYPVSRVEVGTDGRFFLPLPALAVQVYQCQIIWQVGQEKPQTLAQEFPCGKVTALHL